MIYVHIVDGFIATIHNVGDNTIMLDSKLESGNTILSPGVLLNFNKASNYQLKSIKITDINDMPVPITVTYA